MDPDTDLDPDPAIFIINLQDPNKKLIKTKSFCAYYFLKVHLHHFLKIKSQSHKTVGSRFYHYFWLMIEGSGSDPEQDLDPDPLVKAWIRGSRSRSGSTSKCYGSATLLRRQHIFEHAHQPHKAETPLDGLWKYPRQIFLFLPDLT
jgi:hypothetical protein